MRTTELFNKKKVVFSMEIFPPKATSSIETIYKTLEELKGVKPDFISVTYGAGGSVTNNRTVELSSLVKNKYGIMSAAHLTCISGTKKDISTILTDLKAHGIENILALRGDIPKDGQVSGEFKYGTDLVRYIKEHGDFNVLGACYPEGHTESGMDVDRDIEVLKLKEEAGVSHFMSQLFFDNEVFYRYLDKARNKGIKSPIEAGIMPVINKKQIERMATLIGTDIPEKFLKIMNRYEHNPEALRDAGIAYATDQIIDLISSGVDGIHLYTMNNPYVAKKISESVSSIIETINK